MSEQAIVQGVRVRLPKELGHAIGITKFLNAEGDAWGCWVPGPHHPGGHDNGFFVYVRTEWLTALAAAEPFDAAAARLKAELPPNHLHERHSERGFVHMPVITTVRGDRIRICQASPDADGAPRLWFNTTERAGAGTSLQLSLDDARRIADQLDHLTACPIEGQP